MINRLIKVPTVFIIVSSANLGAVNRTRTTKKLNENIINSRVYELSYLCNLFEFQSKDS